MARTVKTVTPSADALARPGPHDVLRGDLGRIGMPGVVFTPAAGLGLPAIAFGHGWLQPTSRYDELFRHLASWGVVAASPATEHGVLPSHRQFAADLRTALDMCTGVRLGEGQISVDPGRLGLAGHAMGGGCAVLAAAADPRCQAVVTLALAETLPAALPAAPHCTMPGLHLVGGKDRAAPPAAQAERVATAWGGPVQLRILPKASHLGFLSGKHWSDLLIDGHPEYSTRRVARILVTAFLLRHLTGETGYDDILESDLPGAPLSRS